MIFHIIDIRLVCVWYEEWMHYAILCCVIIRQHSLKRSETNKQTKRKKKTHTKSLLTTNRKFWLAVGGGTHATIHCVWCTIFSFSRKTNRKKNRGMMIMWFTYYANSTLLRVDNNMCVWCVCVWGEWNNITTATESEFIMENSLLYRNGTERTRNRVENKQNRPRRTSEQQPKTRKSRFSAF